VTGSLVRRLEERLRGALPESGPARVMAAGNLFAWAIILGTVTYVVGPMWARPDAIGSHDWDVMESSRYLVAKTIRQFHQFPFWNPYSCGGHTGWGAIESGTVVMSPWLPFYLAMSLPHAMRVEILGSTLVSALGAWMLAGRFTRSPAARAFVVVVFAVNGRWALQIAAGHAWHLAYAWTPWALYFFDRAVGAEQAAGAPRRRDFVLAAAALALMVTTGGIYPLPQTVFALGAYGLLLAFAMRSLRPIVAGLTIGALAFGLAAPKLLPVIDVVRHHPRLVDSTETVDVESFVRMLTSRDQFMDSRPADVGPWGWHEWGMYLGPGVVAAVTLGCLAGRGIRTSPLKWAGLLLLVLGLGAFHPYAPWPLLHRLPVFRSQHVPSRWMYPALLLVATVTAAAAERALRGAGPRRGRIEVAMIPVVALLAADLASVAQEPMLFAFANHLPRVVESTGPFRTEVHMPPEIDYHLDWAPHSLPAEMANIGTIDCATFPPLNTVLPDTSGLAPALGAKGREDPGYRGEVWLSDGVGQASIARWTPNEVTVRVTGAEAGEHLVLNQNWDAGWSANAEPATSWHDAVAAPLRGPEATVVFKYRPRLWYLGLATFLATAGAVGWAYGRERMARLRRVAA